MSVLILPSCHHYSCRWCSCWCYRLVTRVHDSNADSFTSLTDLVFNARGSSLASLLSPLMPVLILPSCHHYSCRWCSCWCCRLVHDSYADSITSLTDLVVDARGNSLASLLSPLMSVLFSSSCHHYSCRWCSWWLSSIIVVAVDARTDFVVL